MSDLLVSQHVGVVEGDGLDLLLPGTAPVSYTHLTLPTILLV